MKSVPLAVLLALTTQPLSAQVWSPRPIYRNQAGRGVQSVFGSFASSRFQFQDGNFRDSTLVLNRVALRAKDVSYLAAIGTGRTWGNVVIQAGPCRFGSVSAAFSSNYVAAPQRVFTGSMSWPTLSGRPKDPLHTYPIDVPFRAPYIHAGNGRDDFLLDFFLAQGRLASGRAWNGASLYITDGYVVSDEVGGDTRAWADPTTRGCVDSGTASPAASTSYLSLRRYSERHWNPRLRNQLQVGLSAWRMAPNAPFVAVLDFAVNPLGVPTLSGCQRLFPVLSPAAAYFRGTTSSAGSGGVPNLPGQVTYHPAMRNLELFTQFAWADSRTGAMKLSKGSSAKMPEFLYRDHADAKRVCVWSPSLTQARGVVLVLPAWNPIFRYN